MLKLQSALAGELEPLRRIGWDLSQAKLQELATILGIDKLVTKMTQAEKAQLRYYAILTQVTTAQGDMARTLSAPANQLRILSAQAHQAARAWETSSFRR
jgi:predicted MarR family transcription regulator